MTMPEVSTTVRVSGWLRGESDPGPYTGDALDPSRHARLVKGCHVPQVVPPMVRVTNLVAAVTASICGDCPNCDRVITSSTVARLLVASTKSRFQTFGHKMRIVAEGLPGLTRPVGRPRGYSRPGGE